MSDSHAKTQRAHLDLSLVLDMGDHITTAPLQPFVSGFYVPPGKTRHRFVPSIAFPGRDECGYVMGWMLACGLSKADACHRRRSSREVKGEGILKAAAEGRARVAYLKIPGLNAPADNEASPQ